MKHLIAICLLALAALLAGCATTDYETYAKAHASSETARHAADAEKYKALADIAATGSDSARVAAVMALALGGGSGQGGAAGGPGLRAPEASNPLLQWAGVLVPGLVQAYGINANMQLGVRQSDNGASVARSTNDTMSGIAKLIQAPGQVSHTDNHSTYTPVTTNTDRHDVVTPAPVVVAPVVPVVPVITTQPVINTPPVVITPVIQITPITTK